MAGNSTDAGRSVSSKVTAILMVFADGDVHTLTEIAASADLLTSTAHRLARNWSPGAFSSEPRNAAIESVCRCG
jgi:IclR helix-turn-helix domain